MPTATFIQDGDSLDYTPSGADVAAGDVVVLTDLIGIAKRPIPDGTPGSLAVTGVFELPKATGASTALPAGTRVVWNDVSGVIEPLGSSLVTHAYVTKDAGDDDATVRVRLSP
ncbi:MAG: DUF2190 family protein [Phycisphaerales bacterium JB063]